MRMYDIILKKREGEALTKEEILFFVEGYTKGDIPDYQASALIMAIFLKGMNKEETVNLTMGMMNSGETVDLTSIKGVKVDKHSTGGVGDTTTLVLAPLVAACGVPVAKMSGRGLGHTGGTLDKLESIENFNILLSSDQFMKNVNEKGIAVIGQTKNIAPADKKLYALRDVTATVDNISLIAASIMSKKLAAGSDAIVLDVKTGSGAFIKDLEGAVELAQAMSHIGIDMGRDTVGVVTNMDQPLGLAIGNALEVKEAIDTLKGNGPKDLEELCYELGAHMIVVGKIRDNIEDAKALIKEKLDSGEAFEKFVEFVTAQGGNPEVVRNPELLPKSPTIVEVKAEKSGYIKHIQSDHVGIAAMILGAGRTNMDSKIDLSAGIMLKKKVGDYVEAGQVICELHTALNEKLMEAEAMVHEAYEIISEEVQAEKLIKAIVSGDDVKYL